MIEVVFSGTAYGGLTVATSSHPDNVKRVEQDAKEYGGGIAVKSMEKAEGILSFEFQWDIGYLNESEDSEYRMKLPASLYYGHHVRLHPEDEAELLEDGKQNLKTLKALRKLAEAGKSFRVWYGSNAMEMSGFYYICNVLKDYDVDVYVVELPQVFTIGDKSKHISSWGMAHTYEFGYLVENQRPLQKHEIEYRAFLWQELVEENAPLRAVISNVLTSVPADFYDGIIMSRFTGTTIHENEWVSDIMSMYLGISSGFVEQRIWEMGKNGVISLVQDGERMNERIWEKVL
ncbi:MAG: DUF1835 domain-containing protein [Lachnospiraceae bacterium]|nr:DUF1835 domain-containing protein [Lachnospiraceae bacterium]